MSCAKIVVAPDSYKGSASASEVASAMCRGIKRVEPDAETVSVPMADGGEGTVRALVDATAGKVIDISVTGPLGKKVDAFYGVLGDGRTAVIEMAAAAGLPLVPRSELNPLATTTFGVGEIVKHALECGCNRIIMGIGGSATNDGGAGMAQALGASLLDSKGEEIGWGGAALGDLALIRTDSLDPRARHAEFVVACDVDNPLHGERGAARVFGPQKGATPDMVDILDRALAKYGEIIEAQIGIRVSCVPGSGAAGGLGAGLMAFFGATLMSGIDLVIDVVNLDAKMRGACLIFTGEGKMDGQTLMGKVPQGVARTARKHSLPVIAVVGSFEQPTQALHEAGIDAVVAASHGPQSLECAMANAEENIEVATEQVYRVFRAARKVR